MPFVILASQTPGVTPFTLLMTTTTLTSDFTLYSYDLLTGNPIGQFPARSLKFGQQLNTAGQGSFTIDLTDPRVQLANPIACTNPGRTFVVADYKGAPVWGGIVAQRTEEVQASGTDRTMALGITCAELWSYFAGRVQATDYSSPPYSGITGLSTPMTYWTPSNSVWDTSLIATQVITDALSYSDSLATSYGNPLGGLSVKINSATPSAASPVSASNEWIAVNYPYTSAQTVDMIVSQLAQLGYGVGFDYGVDIAYSSNPGSKPVGTVNLSYPRRGRTTSQNKLLIDLAAARSYRFPEDGTQMANQVWEIGGSGAINVSVNANALAQGYPLWERVMSKSNAQSANLMGLLAQAGASDLALFSYPVVTPAVTLGLLDVNLPLGSFIVGDDVQVILPQNANDGSTFDPRFPAGLNQEFRIVAWQATVGDSGDSTLELTLNRPPSTSVPIAPVI
jgi:hypothetical protein